MVPYMSIPDAAKYTGLSESFLRKGVKGREIPFIMSGKKYLVNVPLMLEKLNEKSDICKK